jgi:hypothetical protein
MSESEEGAWVVWRQDWGAIIEGVFGSEVDALRAVNANSDMGYRATFVPFGLDIPSKLWEMHYGQA